MPKLMKTKMEKALQDSNRLLDGCAGRGKPLFPHCISLGCFVSFSCLAAGDGAELFVLETGIGKTTAAFKTKAARRTKCPCYEASPMWLVSFYFPWAADKVAEDVPDLFAKAQLPGKDLRISRDIAEPSKSVWSVADCICQYLVKDGIQV